MKHIRRSTKSRLKAKVDTVLSHAEQQELGTLLTDSYELETSADPCGTACIRRTTDRHLLAKVGNIDTVITSVRILLGAKLELG